MEENKSRRNGTTSLVLGILGLVFFWVPVVGFLMALFAIILYNKEKKTEGVIPSTASLVLGIFGVILGVLSTIFILVIVGFQAWFTSYQSDVTAEVEEESQTGVKLSVDRVTEDKIFINNKGGESVDINSIIINGNNCGESSNFESGLDTVSLNSNCDFSEEDRVSVVLETAESGIFESEQVVR